MEQTIGKRIMQHRKQLGMTQDQLAEKLGVTAQAVSKWENDQSCPDITMLPKLAEIFGISTDELLGRAPEPATHRAERVDRDEEDEDEDDEDDEDGIHIQHNGGWEFQWDAGRAQAVTFAILVLLVGMLTLADKMLGWEVGFWNILWPSTLLVYGVKGLFGKFSFVSIGCTLFGGYFLLENLHLIHLDVAGEMVFPIIVVLFGISLLVDALRKPKKPRFKLVHKGTGKEKTSDFHTDKEGFTYSMSFSSENRLITLPVLTYGSMNCSFGELKVDLSGCEKLGENCVLEANCSFGELEILVPRCFRVEPDSSVSFGELRIKGEPDEHPQGILTLNANVSFGEIVVRYV